MTKKIIDLGNIKLSANDFIERATGLIAKRGKGKSGLLKVIEEELLKQDLPFVVFDPTGIHWGIKSSFDGKKPSGFKVIVIGGAHGDLPLDKHSGRIVAKSIANTNVSLIVDFKGSSHATYRQFVADFSDELLNINAIPRLLIIEEARRLLPQKLRPDQTVSFDAVATLVLEGRNSGLGCILVGQRAATINKDVLTQVDNMIVMGLTGPQDKKAIKEWVEENADPEMLDVFIKGLSTLQAREGWFWSPDAGMFDKFRIKDFTTFHPDRTHLRRMGLLETHAVVTDTKLLVETLGSEITEIARIEKENNPASLKKSNELLKQENETLKRKLEGSSRALPVSKESETIKEVKVEIPIITEKVSSEIVSNFQSIEKKIDSIIKQRDAFFEKTNADIAKIIEAIAEPKKILLEATKRIDEFQKPVISKPSNMSANKIRPNVGLMSPVARVSNRAEASDSELTGPQQKILNALAWLESIGQNKPIKKAVAVLAGYSPKGGGFTTPLSKLNTMSLIRYEGDSRMTLTDEGRSKARYPNTSLTIEDIQSQVFSILDGPEKRILKPLIECYPRSMDKDSLAVAAGYTPRAGGFTTPLSRLRTMGIIDYPESNQAKAEAFLFLE